MTIINGIGLECGKTIRPYEQEHRFLKAFCDMICAMFTVQYVVLKVS